MPRYARAAVSPPCRRFQGARASVAAPLRPSRPGASARGASDVPWVPWGRGLRRTAGGCRARCAPRTCTAEPGAPGPGAAGRGAAAGGCGPGRGEEGPGLAGESPARAGESPARPSPLSFHGPNAEPSQLPPHFSLASAALGPRRGAVWEPGKGGGAAAAARQLLGAERWRPGEVRSGAGRGTAGLGARCAAPRGTGGALNWLKCCVGMGEAVFTPLFPGCHWCCCNLQNFILASLLLLCLALRSAALSLANN